jgi:hypothetical protein
MSCDRNNWKDFEIDLFTSAHSDLRVQCNNPEDLCEFMKVHCCLTKTKIIPLASMYFACRKKHKCSMSVRAKLTDGNWKLQMSCSDYDRHKVTVNGMA